MAPLDIPRLAPGDRVQHELLVRERDDKVTKTGDPFVVLKLGNASGVLGVNIWKEHVPQVEGVRPGQVVQVIGTIELYKGARQLKLTVPPRVVAQGAANADEFLPRITVSIDELWARVDAWRAEMKGPLRRAVDLFFADEAFRERFARAPGATRGHHALIGGLLLHSCEVANIARESVRTMRGNVAPSPRARSCTTSARSSRPCSSACNTQAGISSVTSCSVAHAAGPVAPCRPTP
jgi:3'-5' exoribonuclease